MVGAAYSFRKNPSLAIKWVDEVLAGSSTGCIEVRRHRALLWQWVINLITMVQRYRSGRCINCDAQKVVNRGTLICAYCEMVPPRTRRPVLQPEDCR